MYPARLTTFTKKIYSVVTYMCISTLIKNMTHFLTKSGVLLHVLYAQCTKYAFVPPATCINTVPSTSKHSDLRKSWKNGLRVLAGCPVNLDPEPVRCLQLRSFTDSVHDQKYITTSLDLMWTISFSIQWLLYFFHENLKVKEFLTRSWNQEKSWEITWL